VDLLLVVSTQAIPHNFIVLCTASFERVRNRPQEIPIELCPLASSYSRSVSMHAWQQTVSVVVFDGFGKTMSGQDCVGSPCFIDRPMV